MYLLAFIFCMGIAAGAGWIMYKAIGTYNRMFHKFYFYYLLTFYAFAIYGLLGQYGLRRLLMGTSGESLAASVSHFLAMLGLPFLFISWGMLVKMGYSLVESKAGRKPLAYHAAFLTFVAVLLWTGYYMAYNAAPMGPSLIYLEMGLLLLMDLLYLALFARIVLRDKHKFRPPASRLVKMFLAAMFVAWAVRAGTLPFVNVPAWYGPLLLIFFFLANSLPVLFIHYHGDSLFTPDFAGYPDDKRKAALFEKFEITPREQEIIQKICEGKTNQQIADELFISLQTVKDHTHRIYSKIGIHSRLKLAHMVNG